MRMQILNPQLILSIYLIFLMHHISSHVLVGMVILKTIQKHFLKLERANKHECKQLCALILVHTFSPKEVFSFEHKHTLTQLYTH